ncbi:hypothetical protein PG987_003801 [Apiospora arundinis]
MSQYLIPPAPLDAHLYKSRASTTATNSLIICDGHSHLQNRHQLPPEYGLRLFTSRRHWSITRPATKSSRADQDVQLMLRPKRVPTNFVLCHGRIPLEHLIDVVTSLVYLTGQQGGQIREGRDWRLVRHVQDLLPREGLAERKGVQRQVPRSIQGGEAVQWDNPMTSFGESLGRELQCAADWRIDGELCALQEESGMQFLGYITRRLGASRDSKRERVAIPRTRLKNCL